jgi:hypothetical protein
MPSPRLVLILVLLAGAPLQARASGIPTGVFQSAVRLSVYTALPTPPVAQVLPGITESTRAQVLVLLAQGNFQAAIAA